MKKIPVGDCRYSIVDDEDFQRVSVFKWRFSGVRKTSKGYVYRYISRNKSQPLHRFIMEPKKGMVVDHINGDTLDNTRNNLRVCTNQENSRNRVSLQKNNTSGYRGVSKTSGGWGVQMRINGKRTYIGFSTDKIKAAKMYDEAAKKYHGEFASLNFK